MTGHGLRLFRLQQPPWDHWLRGHRLIACLQASAAASLDALRRSSPGKRSLSALQANRERKSAAYSRWIRFNPNRSVMAFNNLFAHGQSNTSAATISIFAMKALEYLEYPLGLIGGDANAVVVEGNPPSLWDTIRMHIDLRRTRFVRIFDGIRDQILENTGHFTWGAGD